MAEITVAAARAILILTFLTGFALGYKAKEWRIRWMKRRRDRLAAKLKETEKMLDILAPS